MKKRDRLDPKNSGNARLCYIDGDPAACDICDEKHEAAILETIGGPANSVILRICKKCLKKILKRFSYK